MNEERKDVIARLIQSKPRNFWLFQRLTSKVWLWVLMVTIIFIVLAVSDIVALEIARSLGRQVPLKRLLLLDLESLVLGIIGKFVSSRLHKR